MTEDTPASPERTPSLTLPPVAARYGVAIVAWFLALLLTLWLAPHLTRVIFLMFWPAVIAAAWYGGRGPALLAIVLSMLSVDYFLLPPVHQIGPHDFFDLLTLGVFGVLAAGASELTSRLRIAEARRITSELIAVARAKELDEQRRFLEEQVEEAAQLTEELQNANQEMEASAEEAEEARVQAEEEEKRLRVILDSLPDGAAVYDSQWRWRHINPASAVRMSLALGGRDASTLIGKTLWDEFPMTVGAKFQAELLRAVEERRVREFEQEFPAIAGWLETRVVPLADGAMVLTRDISDRKRLASELAAHAEEQERTAQREHFLAEASRVLSSSLDYEATIRSVAQLAVPTLADWCSVELLNADGVLDQLAVTHVDPARIALAGELRRRYPTPPDAPTGAPQVVRTGRSEFIPVISDEMVAGAAKDPEHLAILREVGLRSAIVVPIAAAGAPPRGALVLVTSAESGRLFTNADLLLAEELGRRAAMAIEHALLFRAEREARSAAEEAAERTTRLQSVTAALSTARTVKEVSAVIANQGLAAFEAADAAVCLLDRERGQLEIVESVGLSASTTEEYHFFPLAAPLPVSDAVRTGEAVYLESRAAVRVRYPLLAPANAQATTEAWMALPLQSEQGPLGGIAFGFREEREFSAADRDLALALAQQCAVALERARLLETERRARKEAEEANRAKTDFLAVMSHELRTPLNAIAGHAELIEMGIHGPVTTAQDEALTRIRKSQRHLLGLINDVLNFAKLESGHVEFQVEPVSIPETMRAIEPLISTQLRAKALRYSHDGCGQEQNVLADSEKLRQILLNLLSNAIKFTPDGGEISVSCEAVGQRVAIRVKDTGIGIPSDRFEQIFAPFVQVNRAYNSGHEGTGLGLAISRDLANGMDGELSVESIEAVGSTFTLTLPKAE